MEWILQKLEFAGDAGEELTLKSDQEESVLALKRAVAARRMARTTMVESQVRVSRTNPRIERGIGKWRSQFRKFKLHLESKLASASRRTTRWLRGWWNGPRR